MKIRLDSPFFEGQTYGRSRGRCWVQGKPECICPDTRQSSQKIGEVKKFCKVHRIYVYPVKEDECQPRNKF